MINFVSGKMREMSRKFFRKSNTLKAKAMGIITTLVNVVIIGLWGLVSVSIFVVSFRDAWNEVGKECFEDLKSGIGTWKSKMKECIEIIRK